MLSEQRFLEFYRESAAPLRRYIVRTMGAASHADDIVQEAYLRILRHPPSIEAIAEMRAYLFRVASNLIIDRWRNQKHEAAYSQSAVSDTGHHDETLPLDMQRLFLRLRPLDRQLMWLAYVEGASHREIAASLQLRERSIRVMLVRAKRKLLELLNLPDKSPRQTTEERAPLKRPFRQTARLSAVNE